jgi:hypothetical protein
MSLEFGMRDIDKSGVGPFFSVPVAANKARLFECMSPGDRMIEIPCPI